jgi:hypothetical protein
MTSSSTDRREVRKFGLIALIFFGILAGLGLWRARMGVTVLFGTLALFGALFLLLPGPTAPLYRGWMKIARRIGIFMTALVLAIAFYVVITPAGLIKRVFGGRPLPFRPDPDLPTYWVARCEPAQPKVRFRKRY